MTALTSTHPGASSKGLTASLWVLQIAAAAMFFLAGFSKLAGAAPMVEAFAKIGIGQWFRYVTGAIEVVSAAMLLVPSLAVFGAALLVATMIGAIVTHLFIIGGNPAIPVVLLLVTGTVVWLRRGQLRSLVG